MNQKIRLEKRIEKLEAVKPVTKKGKVIIYDPEKRDDIDLSQIHAKTVFLIPDNDRDTIGTKTKN